MRNALLGVLVGGVLFGGVWWYMTQMNIEVVQNTRKPVSTEPTTSVEKKPLIEQQGAAIGDENLVTFKCDGGKTITAVFEREIVALTLSDGRHITLQQATSGSGIRYLSNDSSIEFREKGNEGFLIEKGATTYSNCAAGR